jgi:HEAT repeat protein
MEASEFFEILRDTDKRRCLEKICRLSETDGTSISSMLLNALEESDDRLRRRAAWILTKPSFKEFSGVTNAFISHLRNDSSDDVRLTCAIGLMSRETPQVREVYIHAIKDKNEKVAQISCLQLGSYGGEKAIAALFERLAHNSTWCVRLQICKALITAKAADQRVVTTLEKMSLEPEAKEYDAQNDEFAKIYQEIHSKMPNEPKIKMWGKIGTILEQAKQIAARKN